MRKFLIAMACLWVGLAMLGIFVNVADRQANAYNALLTGRQQPEFMSGIVILLLISFGVLFAAAAAYLPESEPDPRERYAPMHLPLTPAERRQGWMALGLLVLVVAGIGLLGHMTSGGKYECKPGRGADEVCGWQASVVPSNITTGPTR